MSDLRHKNLQIEICGLSILKSDPWITLPEHAFDYLKTGARVADRELANTRSIAT